MRTSGQHLGHHVIECPEHLVAAGFQQGLMKHLVRQQVCRQITRAAVYHHVGYRSGHDAALVVVGPAGCQRRSGRLDSSAQFRQGHQLGGPVAGPERAKSVAVRDGRTLITDGPFPEFKEWFAGYDVITADSIDEAAEYMTKHPVAVLGRIYILPLVALPWDQE